MDLNVWWLSEHSRNMTYTGAVHRTDQNLKIGCAYALPLLCCSMNGAEGKLQDAVL